MIFGLKDHQLKFLKNGISEKILKKYPEAQIWIFGSRARGDYKPASDVDILFKSSQRISFEDISLLRELFEESSFPFKVDLVLDEQLAESYRPQVEREKKPLF